MDYKLVILKKAAAEAAEAYRYYESLQTGLGDRFLMEVLERYNTISKHPQYYGFIDDQNIIRDVSLRKFPYQIVYAIEDELVVIYSIHNSYRHPDKRF